MSAGGRLVWSDRYATGIDEIDEQHETMFAGVNELLAAVEAGVPSEKIGAMLDSLQEHAVLHFECEERHMDLRKCSVCAANRVAHREFLRDFARVRELFDKHGADESFVDAVDEGVCDWLQTHIMAIDIALRETVS